MNNRTKTLWLPALASLTGSMAWRLILQRSFPQSQTLLNHAGLPLAYQILWLAVLPVFGALSAYLSRRSGGDRLTGLTAALSPSIVMTPLWIALATRMSHPSPRQWFGLLCGVLNWIVSPGIALSLGAWFLPSTRTKKNMNTRATNTRTRTFWLPAHRGYGLSDDLDARWSRTSICRAGMGNLCGLPPLAPHAAAVWCRWSVPISPRRRRTHGVLRRWFVSCHRDDELGRGSHGYRQVRLCQAPVALFLDSCLTRRHSSRRSFVVGGNTLREVFETAGVVADNQTFP